MVKLISQSMLLLTIALFLFSATSAQSVTGTWKRLSTVLEYQDGKKDNLQLNLEKNMPCIKTTKYIFKADGTHYAESSKGCEMVDKMSVATWKMNGNQMIMQMKTPAPGSPSGTTYLVSFSGDTMTLIHLYTEDENKPYGTKLKQLITIYQRI